jgi:Cu+-exporting ATPase
MWTLISLGVAAAYLYSIVATFLPGVFPEQYRMGHGVGTYFEAAVVIVALVFVGQVLELRARERTGDAIRALLDLAPKTARRILPDGTEYDAPLENISTAQAIKELHAQGLRVIIATGDNERTAQAVAARLGIDEVRAGVLPEAKKDLIDQLRREGHKIAMAGDGVNDAPALAAADVGIAMGTGADVAMESAGITLLGGDLMGIVRARKLARATLRNIKQNLFFAFAYNALGVPIAAGLLYPVTGLLLSPMIAAAAMSLSSVSVITNALRLRRVDL